MGKSLIAAGGMLSALAASTCCVLPISLGTIGLGGAWLSTLTVLTHYEMPFRIAGIVLLAVGFWLVYAPARAGPEAAACLTAPSQRATKTVLWAGAAVMAVVLAMRWFMPMQSIT